MIIIALATVSVLLGSLLYSNLAFGASGSSGSWGAIRFVEPGESTTDQDIWKDVATFTWIPNNSTNNAIVSIITYYEAKANVSAVDWSIRGKIGNWTRTFYPSPSLSTSYKWYSGSHYEIPFIVNQDNYTIVLQIATWQGKVYIRNINIIVTVADGMVPNEYYKVELPSEGVGGLYIPVDKISLLAPYITLVSTIILAVSISVAYIKYRKITLKYRKKQ